MPSPVASFNFATAANQNPILSPWVSETGVGLVAGRILSGQYLCSADATNSAILYDGGIVWPVNQVVQATLAALAPNTGFAGLNLDSYYQLGIDTGQTPGGMGLFSTLKFIKNGSTIANFSMTPNINDVMMASVVNGLLSFSQNGNLIGTFLDTTPIPAGQPGLTNSPYNGAAANIAWGGTFSAAPTFVAPGTGLLVQFPVIFVQTPGTPVPVLPVAKTVNCSAVYFEALPTNAGKVYIGLASMVKGTLVGVVRVLVPPPVSPTYLDSWTAQGKTSMAAIDLNTLFVDADISGDGVAISYLI